MTSPSFVLVREYDGRMPIFHVDAYRLSGADDLVALGSDEFLCGDGLCIVEWADRAAEALPDERLDVFIEHGGARTRRMRLVARGARHARMLRELRGYLSETDQ